MEVAAHQGTVSPVTSLWQEIFQLLSSEDHRRRERTYWSSSHWIESKDTGQKSRKLRQAEYKQRQWDGKPNLDLEWAATAPITSLLSAAKLSWVSLCYLASSLLGYQIWVLHMYYISSPNCASGTGFVEEKSSIDRGMVFWMIQTLLIFIIYCVYFIFINGKESACNERPRFNSWVGWRPLGEGIVHYCGILAWIIPRMRPGGLVHGVTELQRANTYFLLLHQLPQIVRLDPRGWKGFPA